MLAIDFELRFDSDVSRDTSTIDDSPQHLAPASRRRSTEANCMNLANLAPKRLLKANGQKNFSEGFRVRRKNENAARGSGVHLQCRAELPHAIALMRALSR